MTRFLASMATVVMLTAGLAPLSGCSGEDPEGAGGRGGAGGGNNQGGGGNNQGGGGNNQGGGGSGGQGGSNNTCSSPEDCPGTDTDCATRTCDDGVCGVSYAPQGTATTDQSSGDCKQSVCDGMGEVTSVEDTADVLDDANPCTEDTCEGDAPKNTNLPPGTACDVNDGKVCNGEGACVECIEAAHCESKICTSNACVPASCMDQVMNGSETDIDCGGPDCTPCDDTRACLEASDCKSGVCTGNACAAPACDDTVKNGEETDADCGGPTCSPCGPEKGCTVDGDCVGGTCSGSICVPTCTDGVKNANETDADCGGPLCGKCEDTKTCSVDADCVSDVCVGGVCAAPTCSDGKQNGGETAKDCGGPCGPCGDGLACADNDDCTSSVCIGNVCQSPSCGDGVVNGTEMCDDGNQDNTDACPSTCKVATCGDTFVLAGVEQCDDGNQDNTDGCVAGCKVATCGDGYKQAGTEQCDDGNTVAGDCCATSCTVEAGCELEPNNTCAAAPAPVAAPTTVKGSITPAGDQDFFAFTVPATADLKIETFDGTPGTCVSVDTVIEFRGSNCTTVLDFDDESGVNSCSKLDSTVDTPLRRVAPGTYYVRVEDYQNNGTIPNYLLQISFNALCGDGQKQGSEQCDDGNVAGGDGCASNCMIEAKPEVEPNDTCAAATGPFPVPTDATGLLLTGAITPIGDDDWFAFTLPAAADVHIETFDMNGPGTCTSSVDTVIQLYSDCATALGPEQDQGAISNCSRIDPNINTYARRLPAGTYRVKVIDYQDNSVITGYKLQVKITALCGNGVKEGSEECDGGPSCTATCEVLREVVCNDGVDDDNDGSTDCADTECAFGCGLATPCDAGQKLVVYNSKDTPLSIPDVDSTTSTMNVAVTGTVQRAAVQLNVTHTWIEDVDVSLASPAGPSIDLTSDNGEDFDNYVNTVLDDTCAAPITSGAAPFTGCFSPEAPLATFNGQASAGAWKLGIGDDEDYIVGTLNNWSLALCVAP
ncbi:proprotein convertase P-domain-containing protein [Polyangium jinanense]|uniref:Pre-peptidase C-terminal domain-containing protein n=1 Tax=Polyangium jinanense TaxID=2829994 RepID=A0A9X3X981_9BACT|nr:proprotein convertase P-domain-containing protein [Polyangium jinanense]MDC3959620.1 pre-peptidase C-terminal domain-containing protein [Polyangium jinanense]MDC3986532.1 pre-peptidase C-terminal domain-containing protein [Polyangium jinanense]